MLVGVKFDGEESKNLLTWALVKVAQPGDHIVALHILDTAATGTSHIFSSFFYLFFLFNGELEFSFVISPESTASILSLVKTYDSILTVYEGFCNLKQVKIKKFIFYKVVESKDC